MVVDENSIQFMAMDYIRAHEAIQETVKQLKMLKEQRAMRESQIAKFLADNHSTALDLKGSKYRFYRYDDRIILYCKKIPNNQLVV